MILENSTVEKVPSVCSGDLPKGDRITLYVISILQLITWNPQVHVGWMICANLEEKRSKWSIDNDVQAFQGEDSTLQWPGSGVQIRIDCPANTE